MDSKLAGGKTVEITLPGCEHPLVIPCALRDCGGSKFRTSLYISCIAIGRKVENGIQEAGVVVCRSYLKALRMPFEKTLRYIIRSDSCCELYSAAIDLLLVFHFMLAASIYMCEPNPDASCGGRKINRQAMLNTRDDEVFRSI